MARPTADEECIDHVIGGKCTPRAVDGAIAGLAGRQHGVVGRWQLLGAGVGRRAIEVRCRRGGLFPVHSGVYAVGHPALRVEGRWMAAVLACGPSALLSHRTAGQLWGVLPRTARLPEVTRPGYFRARPGIAAHRSSVPEDERARVLGIPVTSVSRTLLDLAAVLPKRGLERALNEAEVRQLTDSLSLPGLLARYPRRRGAASLRSLLAATGTPRGIVRSPLEERFVAFLDAHDLPRPRLNATLAIRGRFLEVDCLWQAQRLVAELDGRAFHDTGRAFEGDRERDRILVAEGWRVTRITWRHLDAEADEIAADLRKLLRIEAGRPTLS